MQSICRRCFSSSSRLRRPVESTSPSASTSQTTPVRSSMIPEFSHVPDRRLKHQLQALLGTAAVLAGNSPETVLGRAIPNRTPTLSSSPASSSSPTASPSTPTSSTTAFGSSNLSNAEPPSSFASRTPVTYEIPPLEDPLLSFLTNLMMSDGKKASARKHVSLLLSTLHARTAQSPLPLLREAIERAAPSIRMANQKKLGKAVQVPLPLGERQRVHKAIQWILEASDKRKNVNAGGSKRFGERVAFEVEAVLNGTSDVLKRKDQLHQTATVNRANIQGGGAGGR